MGWKEELRKSWLIIAVSDIFHQLVIFGEVWYTRDREVIVVTIFCFDFSANHHNSAGIMFVSSRKRAKRVSRCNTVKAGFFVWNKHSNDIDIFECGNTWYIHFEFRPNAFNGLLYFLNSELISLLSINFCLIILITNSTHCSFLQGSFENCGTERDWSP